MSSSLKILFIPLDSYGHINACVGIAQKLVSHGHRAIFALEAAWKEKVSSRYEGLEEVIYVDRTRDNTLGANAHWIEFMKEFKKIFPLESLEALAHTNPEMEEDFLFNFFKVHEELKQIIEHTVQPDLIVVDTYVTIPSVLQSGKPWVWVTSAQPLICLPDPNLPPARSGYPTKGDRNKWNEFLQLEESIYRDLIKKFYNKLAEYGLEPPPEGGFCHRSPHLNMYAYPEELDYLDIRPLPEKWMRFDHFIRSEETSSRATFEIPDKLKSLPGRLIYISMGSLGCADIDLAKRLIQILSKSPNRFIYSFGSAFAEITTEDLPENIWGAEMVPQTQVLPLVDLVITHGGNNSLIESLYAGKPVIVTPLYDDQRDNAQRVDELGLGARINPYHCEENELREVIERLLNDGELHQRLEKIAKRMQTSNSTERAARAIESLVV